ncbi:M15 family metallopeptidase [Microbacterium testaceum]|uniref:M15 family metallopeptidase n=1 Tax=Microbacterium testaceum TaxID=2033 RepID=UPI0009BD1EB5|nr:M15 family metallopeptidase [Microbacterium testaceum]
MAVPSHPLSRQRRLVSLFAVAGVVVLLLAAVVTLAVTLTFSSFATAVRPAGIFVPTEADGLIAADTPLTVDDDTHPALQRLDPALLEALRSAQVAAEADGIRFDITSGWRSVDLQRRLLADAVRTYGSEELAREYVATPETSSHVTGRAVDIGTLDAQLWIMEHGREWGLCQTYANERWHFERATEPGGECPVQKLDARG